MFELIKKDIGMCRMMLIGAAIAVLLPYLVIAVYGYYAAGAESSGGNEFWASGLIAAAMFSNVIIVFSFPFLGGYIVAGERRERSAEFLAYLPPSRSAILASKTAVCLGWALFAATVFLAMTQFLIPAVIPGGGVELGLDGESTTGIVATVAAMFGVSWLLSCVITSPVLSVVGGLCMPFVVLTVALFLHAQFAWPMEQIFSPRNVVLIFGTIAVVAFVTGWIAFAKRVAP